MRVRPLVAIYTHATDSDERQQGKVGNTISACQVAPVLPTVLILAVCAAVATESV